MKAYFHGAADVMARLMRESGNKIKTLGLNYFPQGLINQVEVLEDVDDGEVAERLNAPVLKTGGPLRGS